MIALIAVGVGAAVGVMAILAYTYHLDRGERGSGK